MKDQIIDLIPIKPKASQIEFNTMEAIQSVWVRFYQVEKIVVTDEIYEVLQKEFGGHIVEYLGYPLQRGKTFHLIVKPRVIGVT